MPGALCALPHFPVLCVRCCYEFVSQWRNLRLREDTGLAKGHSVYRWQGWYLYLGVSDPKLKAQPSQRDASTADPL